MPILVKNVDALHIEFTREVVDLSFRCSVKGEVVKSGATAMVRDVKTP